MKASLLATAALLVSLWPVEPAGRDDVAPARRLSGPVPALPVGMLAGGEVFLEVTTDFDGRVAGVRTLRSTPPLLDSVTRAVRAWRFEPSLRLVENTTATIKFGFKMARVGKVFVGAIVRPPVLVGPTLGTVPTDTDAPDPETPFPVSVSTPAFPPAAFAAGAVLVEAEVDVDGSVAEACVLVPSPPFDEPALDAARRFRFRPSRIEGQPARAYAYLIFGFPLPITLVAQPPRTVPPLVIRSTYGRDLYEFYCASCHGRDAKGNGSVAAALKSQPSDLTRLALGNGGVFPRARIEAIVEGRADPPLVAHGSRVMPVWGPIFRGLDGDEAANRTRIQNIVAYLETLQVRYALPIVHGASRRSCSTARDRPAH
jgi:TonB family protein